MTKAMETDGRNCSLPELVKNSGEASLLRHGRARPRDTKKAEICTAHWTAGRWPSGFWTSARTLAGQFLSPLPAP